MSVRMWGIMMLTIQFIGDLFENPNTTIYLLQVTRLNMLALEIGGFKWCTILWDNDWNQN